MTTSELKKGEIYFCADIGVVEYVGTEKYQGEVYYNFFDSERKLFHWIDPENVLNIPMGAGVRK